MEQGFISRVRKSALGASVWICALVAASASASIVRLNPDKLNAPAGSTTAAYNLDGYTFTATAFDNNGGIGAATELYYKSISPTAGATETGLGVVNTGNHELQAGSIASNPFDFIQFDLTTILNGGATSGAISVASVQSGESFTLFGSNTAGTLGTDLGTFVVDKKFVSFANFGQYDFYSIAATTGDVIPFAVLFDFPAVPEMSALLPIIGLLGIVGLVERQRRRRLA